MKKLESLTKEQEALIPIVRDEWIKFCLGGDQTLNREMAQKGLRWIYGLAKLDEPKVIFVDGPFACQFAVWYIEELSKKKILDKKSLASVGASVRDSVVASLGDSVVASVRASVRASVGDSVGDSVWDSVWDSVVDSVGDSKKTFENYGWCDLGGYSGWTAWVDYFERIGIKVDDKFKPWKELLQSGVFMSIYLKGFAIVCPRPKSIKKDSSGRLHNETGAAAEWEGEEYWFLHGIRVPKWLVMTDAGKIDPQLALTEKNVDVQREIIRKVGAERMLKACNAETLDVFVDKHTKGGNEYKLMRMKVGDIDRKYLYFEHASLPGVWYAQPVEPNLKRALHARAWMLGGEIKDLERMSDEQILNNLPVSVS